MASAFGPSRYLHQFGVASEELDTPIRQITHELDQVSDRASKAVNAPHQQSVTWVEVFQTRSEGRAVRGGSGRVINEDPGGTGNC